MADVKQLLKSFWKSLLANPLTRFGLHTVRNVGIFLLIALAALALHNVVAYLEARQTPAFITILLTVGEYGALIIDVIWFLGDLGIRAIKLLMALWRKPLEGDV